MACRWDPGTARFLSFGELTLYIDAYNTSQSGDAEALGIEGTVDSAKLACNRLAEKGILDPTKKQIADEMRKR